jgi:aspartate ammonia-lyase
MKLLFVIGLIATTATSIAVAQVKNASGKTEREIRQVEEKRREALLRGDTTTLDQIFADEYIVTNQFGGVRTKTQMISDIKSGALKFESAAEDDVVVRL